MRIGITTNADNGVDLSIYPKVTNPNDLESGKGYTHETVIVSILYDLADYFNVDIEVIQLHNNFTNLIKDYRLDVLNVSYTTIKGVFSEKAVNLIPCQVITSAGNEGDKGETYLARMENVISVGAVDEKGNHLDFSSYGFGDLDYVCVGKHKVNGRYRYGTSYAAPVFSFLYTLISKYTNTPMDVINSLVVDVDKHGVDLKTGLGWLRKEDVKKWIESQKEVEMKKITLKDLLIELDQCDYDMFQIHHTFEPSHDDFNGHNHMKLQSNMKNYHVNVKGWSDIAQHISLFPDGVIVTGRDFNKTPVGISSHNDGAFMVEMVGNFDKGNDILKDEQLRMILLLTNYFMKRGIDIVFHREYSYKTCPGNSINKETFINVAKHIDEISPWALNSWYKSVEKGVNDGIGASNNITEEQLMVFFDKMNLI